MIQWVYEAARRARGIADVFVATDDQRIVDAVARFGGKAVLTSPDIASGTDRVAAVAELHKADVYVNIQGDEPLMVPEAIERAAELVTGGKFQMGTVMTPIRDMSDLENRAVVKVLSDSAGRAIYFSRLPIPYSRGPLPADCARLACRRHVGLYSYTRDVLFRIRSLPQSPIEQGEVLEQLRAMEAGIAIGITEVDFVSIDVDTPNELEKARRALV